MGFMEYFMDNRKEICVCEGCKEPINLTAYMFGIRKCAKCVKEMYASQTRKEVEDV